MALRPLSDLFSRRLRQEGGAELRAAAIVAVVNEALLGMVGPEDARAMSFTRESATIETAHSAVAGIIRNHEPELLESINRRLQQQFPNERAVVRHLVTTSVAN